MEIYLTDVCNTLQIQTYKLAWWCFAEMTNIKKILHKFLAILYKAKMYRIQIPTLGWIAVSDLHTLLMFLSNIYLADR